MARIEASAGLSQWYATALGFFYRTNEYIMATGSTQPEPNTWQVAKKLDQNL